MMELLSKIWGEWKYIFQVNDTTSAISLIVIIAMVVISIFSGSFFKTFFQLFGGIILLWILHSISPWLMWGLIVGAVIWYFVGNKVPYKRIALYAGVTVGIILALHSILA